MKSIIVTGTNVTSDKSTYKYEFPIASSANFNNMEVAVSSVSMFYSWPNIHSSKYNNNTFKYRWIDGTVVTVTMPDGFYDVSGLNSYLQSVMVSNKHYLIDADGNYVYYLEIVENATYYSVQLNSYAVPVGLPSGWSQPATPGWSMPAIDPATPKFEILSTNNFYKVIGFSAALYPAVTQTTNQSFLSDLVPQVTPVSTVLMTCTLADNNYSKPDFVVFGFSPDVTYGSQIRIQPPELTWIDVIGGSHPYFELKFLDQDFNPIPIIDSDIVVILAVRQKNLS